jgi:tRNA threonylcarbamoyladenosine biosynthesis protein TsaB
LNKTCLYIKLYGHAPNPTYVCAVSYILCLETATEICSVALLHDNHLLVLEENHEGNSHASQITLLIERVIQKAGITLQQLNGVAVSKGPGSYTGLRVGVSTAKGLCYALSIPLIGVNTLEALAHGFIQNHPELHSSEALFIPMLDARRMEVYCSVFDSNMKIIQQTEAKIIDTTSFAEFPETAVLHFFGNGAAKCKDTIVHKQATFHADLHCSAATMNNIAFRLFTQQVFEDVAYFEPFYLKDFVGTVPKKK